MKLTHNSKFAIAFSFALVGLAMLPGAFGSKEVSIDDKPHHHNSRIRSMTPWGIDWGIGAACYKLNSEVSCIKVTPAELEKFKKTLEHNRSN